jgi:hypothetical protein
MDLGDRPVKAQGIWLGGLMRKCWGSGLEAVITGTRWGATEIPQAIKFIVVRVSYRQSSDQIDFNSPRSDRVAVFFAQETAALLRAARLGSRHPGHHNTFRSTRTALVLSSIYP